MTKVVILPGASDQYGSFWKAMTVFCYLVWRTGWIYETQMTTCQTAVISGEQGCV